jgi:hypothetical protein
MQGLEKYIRKSIIEPHVKGSRFAAQDRYCGNIPESDGDFEDSNSIHGAETGEKTPEKVAPQAKSQF